MTDGALGFATLDIGIRSQQAFQGFPQGLDLLIIRRLQEIQGHAIFAGYTVSEHLHTWQGQATFFVSRGGDGKGLGGIGNGIYPFTQHLAPVFHARLILQAFFADRRHVDHLLQHFLGEDPGLAIDNLHDVAVFSNQVGQRLPADWRRIVTRIQGGFFQSQGGQVLLHGRIILEIGLLLAFLHLVKRRLGNIDIAPLDQLGHLAEEERQQQGTNVRTIHVRIRHDDDAVVAEFFHIVFVAANAAAQSGDQGAHFLGGEHLVETRLFHVEDLALQRQDRLILAVTALFGRAPRRITLHNIEFGEGRVFLLAVRQLAGQAGNIQGTLTTGHFPRLARRIPGASSIDDLRGNGFGFLRIFQQIILEQLTHGLLDRTFHFGRDQLVFGLAGEFGIRHRHGNHRGEAFTGVITGRIGLFLLEQPFLFHIAVQSTGESRAETRQVSTTIPLGDVIGKAEQVFLVGIVPLHGHFHSDAIFFPVELEVEHLVQGRLVLVQVADEGTQTAVILEHILFAIALIQQVDTHPGVQEAQFPQAFGQNVIVKLDIGKRFRRRAEVNGRPAAVGIAYHFQRHSRYTVAVELLVDLAITTNGQLQLFGEGIHYGNAHTMESAGHLVAVVVEFTTGVEHGHDHFGGGHAFFFVHVHGNTPAIVLNGHGFIRVDNHLDLGTVASQRLVDGVIHHLEDHMVQASAIIRIPDVHARALANGVQPFQHLDAG